MRQRVQLTVKRNLHKFVNKLKNTVNKVGKSFSKFAACKLYYE